MQKTSATEWIVRAKTPDEPHLTGLACELHRIASEIMRGAWGAMLDDGTIAAEPPAPERVAEPRLVWTGPNYQCPYWRAKVAGAWFQLECISRGGTWRRGISQEWRLASGAWPFGKKLEATELEAARLEAESHIRAFFAAGLAALAPTERELGAREGVADD